MKEKDLSLIRSIKQGRPIVFEDLEIHVENACNDFREIFYRENKNRLVDALVVENFEYLNLLLLVLQKKFMVDIYESNRLLRFKNGGNSGTHVAGKDSVNYVNLLIDYFVAISLESAENELSLEIFSEWV